MDSDRLKIVQLVGPEVETVWPIVALMLDTAGKYGLGERSLDDVLTAIVEEQSQLWLCIKEGEIKSCAVTTLTDYPQYKVVFIDALSGRGAMQFIEAFWDYFCNWASVNGAVAIEACTRPAMTRLLRKVNMRKVYDVVRYSLERPNVRIN